MDIGRILFYNFFLIDLLDIFLKRSDCLESFLAEIVVFVLKTSASQNPKFIFCVKNVLKTFKVGFYVIHFRMNGKVADKNRLGFAIYNVLQTVGRSVCSQIERFEPMLDQFIIGVQKTYLVQFPRGKKKSEIWGILRNRSFFHLGRLAYYGVFYFL